MKTYMARDAGISSLQRVLSRVLLKWLSVVCLIILFSTVGPGIVYSSSETVPLQGKAEEAPPDYTTMRLVGAMKIGRSALVVFENARGEQTSYPVGRTFSDGSKITAVNDRSILVRRADGSAVEYFVAPGDAGKPGTASIGRPVTENPRVYVPPPPSVPESDRAARKMQQRRRDSEQDE